MDIKPLSSVIGHKSSATTLDIYAHTTDAMQFNAATNIERGLGENDTQEEVEETTEKTEMPMTDFEPYKGKIRKPGTGCISQSKENGEKSICFVTGVPGAGKTLVGLDVAVRQTYQGNDAPVEDEGAVYLSGNGPLVAVLTEALAKDNYQKNPGKKISDSRREVGKFIQIIHRYRDNMLAKKIPLKTGF